MNAIIDYNNVQQFCRTCFEVKPNLISSYTRLYIGSYSSTIDEILRLLEEDVSILYIVFVSFQVLCNSEVKADLLKLVFTNIIGNVLMSIMHFVYIYTYLFTLLECSKVFV